MTRAEIPLTVCAVQKTLTSHFNWFKMSCDVCRIILLQSQEGHCCSFLNMTFVIRNTVKKENHQSSPTAGESTYCQLKMEIRLATVERAFTRVKMRAVIQKMFYSFHISFYQILLLEQCVVTRTPTQAAISKHSESPVTARCLNSCQVSAN